MESTTRSLSSEKQRDRQPTPR
jgi:hypothetical protein